MRPRSLAAVSLVVAVLSLSATVLAVSLPYEANDECLGCHDTLDGDATFIAVDFRAPAVDYARCNRCHLEPPHYDTGEQCNLCHTPWPTRTVFYDGSHILNGGFYDTSTSMDADAATLHDIHVNGSWVKDLLTASGCDTCHHNAACNACHVDGAPHGDHTLDTATGVYAYPPVEYTTCNGVAAKVKPVTCVDEACHALASAGDESFDTPACAGCHTAQHAGQSEAHDAGADTCGDTGCHDATDVSVPHGATTETPLEGCDACHAPGSTPPTAECATCHEDVAGDHHALHDASGVLSPGCGNCHSAYLDDEHAAAGLACATCHQSTVPAVVSAIATGDRRCDTCHPDRHFRRKGR